MTTQAGAGDGSRGGSAVPGTSDTVATVVALVVVATHGDGPPMVVAGVPGDTVESAQVTLAAYTRGGWSDVHLARETTSYQRLT